MLSTTVSWCPVLWSTGTAAGLPFAGFPGTLLWSMTLPVVVTAVGKCCGDTKLMIILLQPNLTDSFRDFF